MNEIIELARTNEILELEYITFNKRTEEEVDSTLEDYDIYNDGPYCFLDAAVSYYSEGYNDIEIDDHNGPFRLRMYRNVV